MDGILCVDKPGDHTSFDVIARIRGILHIRKVGHGGTLDPMATGVLPVFLGRATRCCDLLPMQRKRYRATARLGIETDTQDITGRVLREERSHVTRAQLEGAMEHFRGSFEQVPPMYSAVQVGGRRLYDLARKGIEVERPSRTVTVYELELLDFDEDAQIFTFEAECSKGTYVRTLCCDVAAQAGSLACLTALRRTMSAGFTLSQCVTLEELQLLAGEGRAEQALLPIERAFEGLPRIELSEAQARMIKNGVKLDLRRVRGGQAAGAVAVFGPSGEFLAHAQADQERQELRSIKLFCPAPGSAAKADGNTK